MNLKRLLALLLSACLMLPMGLVCPSAKTSADTEEDLWTQIERYENRRLDEQGVSAVSATEADFAAMADGVQQIVENWSGFVPGSIVRNGDFLIWDGTDGIGYGWSPRLRKILRAESFSDANPAYGEGVETESYAQRGGSPSSSDVTVFGPYYGLDSSFTDQYKNEGRSIAQATGGTYTCYQKYDVNIKVIAEALESSGVVIFDSHGSTDYASGNDYTSRANTSYLCINSGDYITSQDMATVQGPYGGYKHAINGGDTYFIDGTAIANHMKGTAPNSFLWMAICLGMATDGMYAPLHARGVEVVYGYSQSVTFSGDYAWERCFWNKMKADSSVSEAIAYMKEQIGVKDPYTNSYPAYPIVVSSEDAYPGHGNVDAVQTVHSSWTLFPQFTITAESSDPDLGTVSVSGTTITATPNAGCAVTGYEVLSGSAKVTQYGDGLSETQFSVRAESDCRIRIRFAVRVPVKAMFVTPVGVTCEDISAYSGDRITIPTPSGTPAADAQPYMFYGWTETPVSDTGTRPDCLLAGDTVVLTEDRTFYALYCYTVQSGMPVPAGTFLRVISEPDDWSGEAMLTYEGQVVLSANSGTSAVSTSYAAVAVADAGIRTGSDTLTTTNKAYIYVIESVGDGNYTIQMKGNGLYLCYMGGNNKLSATNTLVVTDGTSAAYWTIGWKNGKPVFTNNLTPSATLCYDTGSQCFTCRKNNTGEPLTVYAISDSSFVYTTEAHSEPTLYGDANCDGKVSTADAALILRALVGLSTISVQGMANAQVHGSKLSAEDAAAILRYVVRLIDVFPAAQ